MTDEKIPDPVGRGGLDPFSHQEQDPVPVDVLVDVETLARGVASQSALLQSILETLQYNNVPVQLIQFDTGGTGAVGIITNRYHNHTKLYVEHIQIDAHGVIPAGGLALVLNVGERRYPFNLAVAGLSAFPFPIIFERGVDVFWTLTTEFEFWAYVFARVHSDPIGA